MLLNYLNILGTGVSVKPNLCCHNAPRALLQTQLCDWGAHSTLSDLPSCYRPNCCLSLSILILVLSSRSKKPIMLCYRTMEV